MNRNRKIFYEYKALISLIVLIILYIGMIGAEFFAPYAPDKIQEGKTYHPPNVRLYSSELGLGLQVQEYALVDILNRKWLPIKGQYEKIQFFASGTQYTMWKLFSLKRHLFGTKRYPVYIMGADHLGRDLFSRIIYGSRVSLTIGILAVLISLPLGILLGGLAGFYGGAVDWIIMRISEFFILIPGLYLLLFLRSIFLPHTTSAQAYIIITIIFAIIGFPGLARMIRGMFHSIKTEDFIKAALLDNTPTLVIIFRHILPYLSSILLVSISFSIPAVIMAETVLGYLGLGITDPSVSWGSLLTSRVLNINVISSHPWVLYPGVFLILIGLSFNFIGERLRDVLDPYHTGAA